MKTMPELISDECDLLKEFLIAKNKAYGNSVAEPIQIFSKASPLEQMGARIDDKINRLAKGASYMDEDTIQDLIGYLILYKAVEKFIA